MTCLQLPNHSYRWLPARNLDPKLILFIHQTPNLPQIRPTHPRPPLARTLNFDLTRAISAPRPPNDLPPAPQPLTPMVASAKSRSQTHTHRSSHAQPSTDSPYPPVLTARSDVTTRLNVDLTRSLAVPHHSSRPARANEPFISATH